jgi:uncharacterized repeat protein (TIGR01451 family)
MNICIKWVLTRGKTCARLALTCAALPVLLTTLGRAAELQTLRGHVPPVVAKLTPAGRLPASQRVNLAIGLLLRNRETLTNLLHDLYDPANPGFHQYLTPQQFTEQFSPSEADYQAVIVFARANNLTVTFKHPNRVLLDVSGSVRDIEKALHVTMRVYQHPTEARTFYACDVEPALDLATPILTISGLDNYQVPHPNYRIRPALNNPNSVTPNAGSGPSGNYMGRDFRAAYVPGTQLTGAGQVVGLLQFDGYYTNDIATYEALAGLPNVPLENVYVDNFNGTPGPNNLEVCLDIEMVISMAPGVSKIIVYEAGPFGFPDDVLNVMANDNRARQLSASWGWGGGPSPTTDQILQQMIAQGQTFFHSSGDADAFPPGTMDDPLLGFAPGDSPYAIQVGGTTLTTSGPEAAWVSEKVWNWGGGMGSSGGISGFYTIPSWQKGIDMTPPQGSAIFRNVPDVALTADNVFVVADNGTNYTDIGGTSAASPLWAGFTALVNQQSAANGLPPVGFIIPALYAIGKGPNYNACFHDTTAGDNTWVGSPDLFFAVPGYDLCTGWGTPAGTNLINALLAPAPLPSLFVVSNSISGGNGNGIIDFNECDDLTLFLANGGNADATGINATLSTTTPGVAIAQSVSPYPNIPTDGSAANTVPFRISTSPSFVCGTPIDCSLLLQYDQGVSVFRFTLPSGVAGNPVRFDNSSLVLIPSPGTASSPVVVSNINSSANAVTLSLFVTEDFDFALTLELIAPDGTTCTLSANNGLVGQNYGSACVPDSQRTTFDDAATTPIGSGTAPFLGSFKPAQPLAAFTGRSGTNLNGIWQLRASDQFQGDLAAIQCWSLLITPTLCTDGGGQCPGADMAIGMSAQPSPVIAGNNLTYSITVTNLGPSTTTNVSVTQLLPADVNLVSASASQGTYSHQGGAVSFSLGPMSARATAALTVIVQPDNLRTNYTIISTATVVSEQPDFTPGNNSVTVQTEVTPATADLVVGIAAVPNPVLNGSPLTYTVSLLNNGPSPATGITVTNILPFGVQIQWVTVTRGTTTTIGNVVFWNISRLDMGASTTATITVTPTVEGLITASATAAANEFDPIASNNTASVTTTVGPAADLALSITGYPDAVVAGSNVTYTIMVTNQGPSTATSVILNDPLPASFRALSTLTTQGTISVSNHIVSCALGVLTNGAGATITIIAATTTNGTFTTTAGVTATQPDANPANNSATATTTVSAPFISIVSAGAALTYESGPTNGAIDIGETVTLALRLRNVGNTSTRNLVATLLATDGVVPVPPNSPQTYGVLDPSGDRKTNLFTFTASGTSGATISPTLQLQDGTNTYPSVSFSFTLPTTQVFASTNTILIPDPAAPNPPWLQQSGPAQPYPSVINVSNFVGLLGKVTVTLSNLSHTYPGDINALLVAPGGAKTLLMSHAGDKAVAGIDLTFDDSASGPVPASGVIPSGTYQPTAYSPDPQLGGFPANAPAGPYPAMLAAFNGVNPNGAWSLFVFDDHSGDAGSISNGWSLVLEAISPVNQVADLGLTAVATPTSALAGTTVSYVFTITNGGPNTATSIFFTNILPAGVTLVSSSPSQGSVLTTLTNVIASLGTLNFGATATVTNVVVLTAVAVPPGVNSAPLTNTASVASDESDLNPVNNAVAVVITIVRPVADLSLAQAVAPDPVAVGFSLTNAVTITNRGLGTALNAVLTQPLPPGVGFIPASSSTTVGTLTSTASAVTCALGDLASNATAAVIIVLTNSAPGLMTNTVTIASDSYDPHPADNSATYVATVVNPAPQIISAGAVLTYESGPVNGAVDPGETVTLSLALANIGTLDTVNLQATLLPSGGVTSPSGPQFYGALVHGGPAAARSFTFTSAAVQGGATVATLQLQDGANTYLPVSFTFAAPAATNFPNSAAIIIPDHGPGTPYPATINVSSVTGRVNTATVTLNRLAHSFPHDINVVLVSPGGTNILLMSHTGGGHGITNVNLTFADAATGTLPNFDPITAGTYKPSSYPPATALPSTSPSRSYQSALSTLNLSNPNGAWSLYVFDDTVGDSGIIAGGWSLGFTTVVTVGPVTDLAVKMAVPATLNLGGALTNTMTVANLGPDTATGILLTNTVPSGVTFVSASLSQGSLTSVGGGQVICNLGSLVAGATATAAIVTVPFVTGSLVNAVSVAGSEEDLNLANNSAQAKTSVSPSVMDLAVSTAVPASLYVGDALTNTITVTNLGPDLATGVVLTNTLPAGVTFVSAWLSQGNLTGVGGGQVTCNLGSLAAGGSATVIIITVPFVTGSLVNSVNVAGSEEDLNPANNSAQAKTSVSASVPANLSGSFGSGYFQLTVTGQSNTVYVVQASTNLTSWVPLSTNSSATGTFTFTDTTTPAPQQRFYRTLRQ